MASPSEEGDTRDQDTGAKSRTQSGEDPGIGGSEPGMVTVSPPALDWCT